MRTAIVAITLSCAAVCLIGLGREAEDSVVLDRAPQQLRLPMTFVENQGQWSEQVLFSSTQGHVTTMLERDRIALAFNLGGDEKPANTGVALHFTGTSPQVELAGEDRSGAIYNFFLGEDRGRWRTQVPGYASVRYLDIQDGVNLVVQEGESGLRYDLELAAGADLERLQVEVEGVESLRIGEYGELIMATAVGEIAQTPPVAWQTEEDGARRPIDCSFRLLGPSSYGFDVAGMDRDLSLTIDPTLQVEDYATYFIGGHPHTLAVDQQGSIYIAGTTSPTLPPELASVADLLPGSSTTPDGKSLGFLAKLDPDGATDSLEFLTVFGGENGVSIGDLTLGPSSSVFVVGNTKSSGFPRTNSRAFNGTRNAFVLAVDATDSTLIYSTLLGGPDTTAGNLVVDPAGRAHVAGRHVDDGSRNFPDSTINHQVYGTGGSGVSNGLVAILNPTGDQILGSVLIGGLDGLDGTRGIGLDAVGNIYVIGQTNQEVGLDPGTYFPTTAEAFKSIPVGEPSSGGGGRGKKKGPVHDSDGYLFRLSPSLLLEFSTLIGGDGTDRAFGLSLDGSGRVSVVGDTGSSNFPLSIDGPDTIAAIDTILEGPEIFTNAGPDAFVQEYDFTSFIPGSSGVPPARTFSSYYGPDNTEDVAFQALYDAAGLLFIYGRASGVSSGFLGDFPSIGGVPIKTGAQDFRDAFLTVFDPGNGFQVVYSSLVGSSGDDDGGRLVVPGDGNLVLSFDTDSTNLFTTPNAALGTPQFDQYIMRIPIPFGPPPPPTPGITVTPTSGLVTTESGDTDFFTVVLDTPPTALVTVDISTSNDMEGLVSAGLQGPASTVSVTFGTGDWNAPQTVTVTGQDDAATDGDISYTLTTAPASSMDPNYDGLDASDVAALNVGNDEVVVTVSSIDPTGITAGASPVPFMIMGAGFQPDAVVTFENGSGPTPQLTNLNFVSNGLLTGMISVGRNGPKTRVWDIRVTNGGSTGILQGALTVVR